MSFPSSSLNLNYYNILCLICGRNGHGSHFGVVSCRACAAFFRRTVILEKKYRCINRNGKCQIEKFDDKKLFCKFCRLKKCLDSGMTTENVRLDQLVTASENKGSDSDTKRCDHQPAKVKYDVINMITRKPATMIDVSAIYKNSKNILEMNYLKYDDEMINLNSLEKATFSFEKLRSGQMKNPEFLTKIHFFEIVSTWEENMSFCAEWLMYCDEFRVLPKHEKLAFFKIVWAVWRRFERYTMCAEIFGQKCFDEKIVLFSHGKASKFGEYQVDYSNVSNEKNDKISNIFDGKMLQYFDIIVKPFIELDLTTTEVTFVLCHIVWNYASRRLQGQTMTAAEKFLEKIGNNLHEYYEKQIEKPNYAARIIKMMNIVNSMLNSQLKRESTMDMAFLFDLFNIVVTEPDFFRV